MLYIYTHEKKEGTYYIGICLIMIYALSFCGRMTEEKDFTKHFLNEKVTKSFSTDTQTLGMIKDFMEKYHSYSLSRVIDDLVNVGLANFGYRTEQEITERFKGTDIIPEPITVSEPESNDVEKVLKIDFNKLSKEELDEISKILHADEESTPILHIIRTLYKDSEDDWANKEDIYREAEIMGIEPNKVEEALDQLYRDGQI